MIQQQCHTFIMLKILLSWAILLFVNAVILFTLVEFTVRMTWINITPQLMVFLKVSADKWSLFAENSVNYEFYSLKNNYLSV